MSFHDSELPSPKSSTEQQADVSVKLASAFQRKSTSARTHNPDGRKNEQLRVGQVLFHYFQNSGVDPMIAKEQLKAAHIHAYNHSLIRSVLSQKGLIMGGADDHMAQTAQGVQLDHPYISHYVHPDAVDTYTKFEAAVDMILGGNEELCPFDNRKLYNQRVLDRAEVFEAVDIAMMDERFTEIAAVADAHWQTVSGKSQHATPHQ